MNILIKGAIILPMTAKAGDTEKYFAGNVGVIGRRIVFMERADGGCGGSKAFEENHAANLTVLDGTGKVLMPGLINLHNHVSMTLLRGYADDMALMPWLSEKIWPFEAKLTPEDVRLGARLGIAEMLSGGTTTFVDMYWHSGEVVSAVRESGIRGVICPTFVGANYDAFEREAIAVLEDLLRRKDDRIQVFIAPHAPYTCPPETLRMALKLCERFGVGITTHVSETADEQKTIFEKYGKTPTEYLRDLGVFEHPALAAHCVHLNKSDIDIMIENEVSVSHNPHSNLKLASGFAPVADMLASGLNVGIGTDGPSSNNNLDMWEEMRTASLVQKAATGNPQVLPAYEVLQMATVNGARAIGMKGELGIVAPGAKADLMLVDLQRPHLTPRHDLIANLVYSGKASDVDTVIVNGELLVRGGTLLNADLPALYTEVQARTMELAAQAGR